MVHTINKTTYTRKRAKNTANSLVILRCVRRVLYIQVRIEKQLQCAADGILSSAAQET